MVIPLADKPRREVGHLGGTTDHVRAAANGRVCWHGPAVFGDAAISSEIWGSVDAFAFAAAKKEVAADCPVEGSLLPPRYAAAGL